MADFGGSLSSYWWDESKEKVHETLFGIVRFLDQNQSYIHQSNLRSLRLYGNVNVLGLSPFTYNQGVAAGSTQDRVTLNVVQSICDAATQKIAKNKPKATFLTDGGDFQLKRKAKLLDKFSQGQFYKTNFYQLAPEVFKDGTIFGTGAVKHYREGKEIKSEKVFIDELKVDQTEAYYGNPRSLYQVKMLPRALMLKLYPKFQQIILAAKVAEQSHVNHPSLNTNIKVLEAWHLPSTPTSKDGRHVISLETGTLIDEEYKKPFFPFSFIRWSKRPMGFWGQGLAEQLSGIQLEINKILRTIQVAFHLSVPKMMVENGSKVVLSHLNNEIGGILKYFGTKPEWVHFMAVHPQFFEHLERLYQKAYEIAGISQLSAQSKKPEGLDSGKALREYNDIESERFILNGQGYEEFYMDAARQHISLAKDIFEEEGEYEVSVPGKSFLEKIKWSEIDLEDDAYMMQAYPTSFLSKTPSGRLQDIQELIQAGFIDRAFGLKLLDFPDLDSYMSLSTAGLDDLERLIDDMLYEGIYQTPEPFQAPMLPLGIKMATSAYLKGKNEKVPEERLELLRRWIETAERMLPQPASPSNPAGNLSGGDVGGMPGGTPQANPAPLPTSSLIPNVPGVA